MTLERVYEDKDMVVIVKPPGILSQADPTGGPNIYDLLSKEYGKHVTLGLMQRLDRPVGGLILLGKTGVGNQALSALKDQGSLEKSYLAVVEGSPKANERLCDYVSIVRGNRSIISRKKVPGSKEALLEYIQLTGITHEGKNYSLLKVNLITGRHHQIRAQFASHGLPLYGDTKYNKAFQDIRHWVTLGLASYEIAFMHPIDRKEIRIQKKPDYEPFTWFDY